MPAGVHDIRQVCQSLSIGCGSVANDSPSSRACTVVPDGQSRLPYHSTRSTSPPRTGSSLRSQNAGQAPSVRQLSLTRASHVVPMPPRQFPTTLALAYFSWIVVPGPRVARITRLLLPSWNTCSWSVTYRPMLNGLSHSTGFLIISRPGTRYHHVGSGGDPAGPLNSSWNKNAGVPLATGGVGPPGAGAAGPGRLPPTTGSALATPAGSAAAATPRPIMNITLRRSISGTGLH